MAKHETHENGIMIVRTSTGVGVWADSSPREGHDRPVRIEVSQGGRVFKIDHVDPAQGNPWRDYYAGKDMLSCSVKVYDGATLLAELPVEGEPMPFMVRQGAQRHVTEHYVSVPPALTITDDCGATWTLGFVAAPKERSPEGEFAFEVLKDGAGTGEIASRIERRNGAVRIFTKDGWKILSRSGREFL